MLRHSEDFKENETVVRIPDPTRGLPKAVQVGKQANENLAANTDVTDVLTC